ncbi:Gamma-glutamyl-hercynylcysteine sulfoxide hydrolase [Frankia canadensis]|uniref:Gamma-glutamyl-hercynylcysteine sulfoxide hydrolase n=1 Tax=Frankia canadensis TaxID=1836972 RepID=A0A2I2KXY6_9ACTN|nr:ergothioneine biosynthesis protein EgtC [Frankia canadensis]SNQ50525.1 Gamma-glutamyl-hercynylcysteine sulfoxide hydrolase [Frankia canadensis]SOU57815.1 Gamma-glutamyl-hercynylcysteine sulfoxide hydrolase [Frankia canadensis]
MCRHLAWLGAPRTLAALTTQRPFSLLRQSWSPRRMRYGTINADGFGVGWYAPDLRAAPARVRRAVPMWTDASYASMAGVIASGCVLAAVRGASLGMPVEETATAPFTDGVRLLSHNGRVDPAAARALLAERPDAGPPDSTCDSALLAALVFERAGKSPLPDAVADVVTSLGQAALAGRPGSLTPWAGDWTDGHEPAPPGGTARLNLLVTDGSQLVATTWRDTLVYRIEPDGVLVASEPDDDKPGWVDVPDHHLLVADTHQVTLRSLIS